MQIHFYLLSYLFTNTREVFPPLSNHATLTFDLSDPKSRLFLSHHHTCVRNFSYRTERQTDRHNLLLYAPHSGVVSLGRQEIGRKTRPDRNGCSVCVCRSNVGIARDWEAFVVLSCPVRYSSDLVEYHANGAGARSRHATCGRPVGPYLQLLSCS